MESSRAFCVMRHDFTRTATCPRFYLHVCTLNGFVHVIKTNCTRASTGASWAKKKKINYIHDRYRNRLCAILPGRPGTTLSLDIGCGCGVWRNRLRSTVFFGRENNNVVRTRLMHICYNIMYEIQCMHNKPCLSQGVSIHAKLL